MHARKPSMREVLTGSHVLYTVQHLNLPNPPCFFCLAAVFWNKLIKVGFPSTSPLQTLEESHLCQCFPVCSPLPAAFLRGGTLFVMDPIQPPDLSPHLQVFLHHCWKVSPAPSWITRTASENGMFSRGIPSTQAVCSGSSGFSPTVLFWMCHALLAHLYKQSYVAKISQTDDVRRWKQSFLPFLFSLIYHHSSLLLTIIYSLWISANVRRG